MDNKQLYRKLNAYRWENYGLIKDYLTDGAIPPFANTAAKRHRFVENMRGFAMHNDSLVYEPLNLVVLPNDVREKTRALAAIYNNPSQGLGHGILQFYKIVQSRFLNITRKEVQAFLQSQIDYQLSRRYQTKKQPTKKYNRPNACWETDLVDMSPYQAQNKHFNWILTLIDAFSKKCYLRALKTKTPESILAALREIITPTNKPRILVSDMGNEYRGVVQPFLQQLKIKHITSKSYTPVPLIENLNNQLRKFITEWFVRTRKTNWLQVLPQIEANINAYQSLPAVNHAREQAAEARQREYVDATHRFKVGDKVRIQQRAYETEVRQAYKAGLQKHVHVKYSVDIFVINKIYKPNHVGALPYYSLKDEDGLDVVNTDGTLARFKENELMLCSEVVGRPISQQISNRLNNI